MGDQKVFCKDPGWGRERMNPSFSSHENRDCQQLQSRQVDFLNGAKEGWYVLATRRLFLHLQMWKNYRALATWVKEQVLAGQASGRATPVWWISSSATGEEATSNSSQHHSFAMGAKDSSSANDSCCLKRVAACLPHWYFCLVFYWAWSSTKINAKPYTWGRIVPSISIGCRMVWQGTALQKGTKESWRTASWAKDSSAVLLTIHGPIPCYSTCKGAFPKYNRNIVKLETTKWRIIKMFRI